MKTTAPRTAAATEARKANARRRRLRAAASLLREEGFTVEPPNLDAALLIDQPLCTCGCSRGRDAKHAPAGSAHGEPDFREED